ncbi:MAG: hypothetical protein RRZ33_08205 [Lachnospiraceae bacterium]
MRKNNSLKTKRVAACVLAAALTISSLAGCSSLKDSTASKKNVPVVSASGTTDTPAFKASGIGTPYKTETVFVNTDSSGEVTDITVSDWLNNSDHFATLTDSTNLSQVENVKGNESFTQNGEDLNFDSKGNDIYYRGSLDPTAALPVDLNITYKLDGKEREGKELTAATGHLDLTITYTNHSSITETINGREKDLHIPFLAVSTMILPSDSLKNVTITNGKSIESGDHLLLLGYGFPGMNENFDLTDENGIFTDTVQISADVTNFNPDMIMSYYSSEPFASLDLESAINLPSLAESLTTVPGSSDDLDQVINELSASIHKLNDGATAIHTGIATLDAKLALISSGLNTASSGSTALTAALSTVSEKSQQLSKGASSLNTGVQDLVGAITTMYQSICTSIQENKVNSAKLNAGISQLTGGIHQLEQLQAAGKITDDQKKQLAGYQAQLEEYTAKLNQLKGAATALNTLKAQMDSQKMEDRLSALSAGSRQVADGNNALFLGLNTISHKTQELSQGIAQLHNGSILLKKGADTLLDGSSELSQGTQTLSNAFNGNITELLDTAKAIQKAAKEYETFTRLSNKGHGKVDFIIKTQ